MARLARMTFAAATCRSFDGVPIAYATTGRRGPALVFVHGWSCHRGFWREQAALAVDFRILVVDLAGHGASCDAHARTDWSIAAFARDVEAAIDAAGFDDAVVIGHSMGGAVGVDLAIRLGPRCRLLLGVDTFTDARFYRRRPAAEIAARRATFAADFAGTMRAMVAQITPPATPAETVAWIAHEMAATPVGFALDALDALLAWDVEARWPALRAPVATINSAWLDAPAHAIPLAGLALHPMVEVGHFPMLEAPARFNALVREVIECA